MHLDRRLALAGMLAAALPLPVETVMAETTPGYAALALQLTARSVERTSSRAEASAQMLAMIDEVGRKLRAAGIFIAQYSGTPVRLAVLPEYLFTSYPGRISIPDFAEKAALDMDGPEYAALGKIAEAQKLFIAGNAYERDPNFPGLYFQASFVIAPTGRIVLR
jgi:predicted amidohydrolase